MDLGFKLIIDHDHHMISSIIYEGSLHIFLLDNNMHHNNNLNSNNNSSSSSSSSNTSLLSTLEYTTYQLYESRVIDIQFLSGCLKPTIAIIYEDNNHVRNMKTYTIDIRDKDHGLQPGMTLSIHTYILTCIFYLSIHTLIFSSLPSIKFYIPSLNYPSIQ